MDHMHEYLIGVKKNSYGNGVPDIDDVFNRFNAMDGVDIGRLVERQNGHAMWHGLYAWFWIWSERSKEDLYSMSEYSNEKVVIKGPEDSILFHRWH